MRKLIRPSLPGGRTDNDRRGPRRELPPEATHAEAQYLQQAIQSGSLLVITLRDGRVLKARLEYYDRDILKLEPEGGARLLLRKDKIKYYRAEGSAAGASEGEASEAESAPARPAGKARGKGGARKRS